MSELSHLEFCDPCRPRLPWLDCPCVPWLDVRSKGLVIRAVRAFRGWIFRSFLGWMSAQRFGDPCRPRLPWLDCPCVPWLDIRSKSLVIRVVRVFRGSDLPCVPWLDVRSKVW